MEPFIQHPRFRDKPRRKYLFEICRRKKDKGGLSFRINEKLGKNNFKSCRKIRRMSKIIESYKLKHRMVNKDFK